MASVGGGGPKREGGREGRPGPSIRTCSAAEDVLESYENPPPIVLPSQGFQVDLEADCLEDSAYQHLLYIRHFLWGLRGQGSPDGGPAQPEGIEVKWDEEELGHSEQPETCSCEPK